MSTARISGHFLLALAMTPLLMGGACEKKTNNPTDTGAITAIDKAGSSTPKTVDASPLKDIDLSKLDKDKQQTFYKLVNTFKSPCGKGESLRDSYTKDTACKRAPFAVRFVATMLEDEFPEDKVVEGYTAKYDAPKVAKVDFSKAPHVGNEDAAVKIVEFYDYACPHCKEHKPVFDAIATQYEGRVCQYYMMFPLGHWPDSKSAAQAAYAANAQGKFKEMHSILFAKGPTGHTKDAVMETAASLKLDIAKFTADYDAAAKQVEADKAQGEVAGVDSTPTVFFNGRKFEGPITVKYLGLWIDEEIAVNR